MLVSVLIVVLMDIMLMEKSVINVTHYLLTLAAQLTIRICIRLIV